MCEATLTVITAHRAAVLGIVDGLDEALLRTPVVPSGWTVIGMIEHLAWMQAFWGDHVVRGVDVVAPWAPIHEERAYISDHDTVDVLAFFRAAGARLDETLRAFPCEAAPRGAPPPYLAHLAGSVGAIAAHVLEEMARHAGHLDIARELLDGTTGLGPR